MHRGQKEKRFLEEVYHLLEVLICNFGQIICECKLSDSFLTVGSSSAQRQIQKKLIDKEVELLKRQVYKHEK